MILQLGNYQYDLSKQTLVMGIINVTPDSFSDGGNYDSVDRAVAQAKLLKAQGADVLDIGGESTRPGFEEVPLEEELARVLPAISAIKQEVDLPISIDTYKAETARQALHAGADIINDIWGARFDPDMARVAAETDAPIILMHNRANQDYKHLINDVISDLQESIAIVSKAGVRRERIILDPGIGFAKTHEDNMNVLRQLDVIAELGYPLLLGTSRKRVIGEVLDLPAGERDEGTAATTVYGMTKGVNIVRVHEVKKTARMVKMTDALIRGER